MSVLTYGSETMICREKERSRVRDVQKTTSRGLMGIRRMDKVLNAGIRQLCEMTKVFSDGSAMWRKWRKAGLLRRSM